MRTFIGREVTVQSSDLTTKFRVWGRLLTCSFGPAEPELLVLEQQGGAKVLLRNWELILTGEVKKNGE
jgi:hypothetical protein